MTMVEWACPDSRVEQGTGADSGGVSMRRAAYQWPRIRLPAGLALYRGVVGAAMVIVNLLTRTPDLLTASIC